VTEAADDARDGAPDAVPDDAPPAGRRPRRSSMLRLDPAVHDALAAWAAQDLRSVNAHVEWLLRQALDDAGRLPGHVAPPRRRGRPPGS
jgi:hypothetical protein